MMVLLDFDFNSLGFEPFFEWLCCSLVLTWTLVAPGSQTQLLELAAVSDFKDMARMQAAAAAASRQQMDADRKEYSRSAAVSDSIFVTNEISSKLCLQVK